MIPTRPLYLPPPYQDSAEQGRLILRDGTTATIRVAHPADTEALIAFFKRLSPESRRNRFFSDTKPGESAIAQMCDDADPKRVFTLMVLRVTGDEERIIATGSYFAEDEKTAEVAVTVEDPFQGKGLGTLLLERLSLLAIQHGFTEFKAITHPTNTAMLEVFRNSGFPITEKYENEHVTVAFSVLPGADSVARTELRDRLFTAASIRPFFKPQSVAVVGASRNPSSIGYRIMEGLVLSRFQGCIYPVNPKAKVICSMRAYPSILDLPEAVDLAVIVVPRDLVLAAVDDCAKRGVRALIVISAGFAETNDAGRALQDELTRKVRGYGMRMIGPNCLGLLNSDPAVSLNASFSPIFPPNGTVGMSSQSGALGLAILALAKRLNLGLSTFVSIGNKADVSGNDLLQYWEGDDQTNVILLYMESIKNPRRFARIARRVSRSKPIVCVKGGRTSAGRRAAGSHTAALAAADTPVEALFHQTGILRTDTLEEMFDLAATLSNQPLPAGKRVGVVTNAGGPGILCSDTCEANGLEVPELNAELQEKLRAFLPAAAAVGNPVDMIASAPPEHFQKTVEAVLLDEAIDMVIVIYIPVGTAQNALINAAIEAGVKSAREQGAKDKPVVACLMVEEGIHPPLKIGEKERVPVYAFPESAAHVMSKVSKYAEWLRKPPGMIPLFEDVDTQKARDICRNALRQRGKGWLSTAETRDVLHAFRLPVGEGGVATTADDAAALAEEIGYPVAVKLASLSIVHKSDMGGVALNLRSADAVRKAFEDIRGKLEATGQADAMEGVLVQPMVGGGVEVMVGVTHDPVFGPLVAFGLGGVHVEILADICFRVTPLTNTDVEEMLTEIRGHRLLQGYRGHPPADIEAIKEILLRISLLVEEVPEILELDLNPIFALEPGKGCRIVDARIQVDSELIAAESAEG
jgi:acetate---CoA ligase (ADP-forming)